MPSFLIVNVLPWNVRVVIAAPCHFIVSTGCVIGKSMVFEIRDPLFLLAQRLLLFKISSFNNGKIERE